MFEKDLQIGCSLEKILVNNFRFYGIPSNLNQGETYDEKQKYDFIFEPKGISFFGEAKLDLRSAATGNMCIEESTLLRTQADYFFHGLIGVKVFDRKEYQDLYDNCPKKVDGGDGNRMKLALIRQPYKLTVGKPLWKFIKDLNENPH